MCVRANFPLTHNGAVDPRACICCGKIITRNFCDLPLPQDETGEFMRMFWLDATEQNGTIYLIGKVAVPSPSSGSASPQGDSGAAGTTFLSACVAVHSIEREVLVLPRCGVFAILLLFCFF